MSAREENVCSTTRSPGPRPRMHTLWTPLARTNTFITVHMQPHFAGGGGVNRREGEAEQERAGHAGTEEYISNMYIPGTKQQ